mgnify:CR=1 FL=1
MKYHQLGRSIFGEHPLCRSSIWVLDRCYGTFGQSFTGLAKNRTSVAAQPRAQNGKTPDWKFGEQWPDHLVILRRPPESHLDLGSCAPDHISHRAYQVPKYTNVKHWYIELDGVINHDSSEFLKLLINDLLFPHITNHCLSSLEIVKEPFFVFCKLSYMSAFISLWHFFGRA